MVSLIEDYEQQYAVLTADITAQIGKIRLVPPNERTDVINKISSTLDEAHELLEQLGLEIRDIEPNQRATLKNRHNCYEAELKRLEQEFTNNKTARSAGPSGLYESDEFDEVGIRDEQKRRLLDNSERIERTGKQLDEGYRIVLETEQIGTGVLRDLSSQRETIQKARHRLRETDSELGRSSRIMNSMIMRSIREKAILYGVIVIFIIAVTFSIYLSFK